MWKRMMTVWLVGSALTVSVLDSPPDDLSAPPVAKEDGGAQDIPMEKMRHSAAPRPDSSAR